MNNINNQLKYVVFACIALMLVFGAISIAPTQAQACVKVLGFLDPTCVLSGKVSLPALPSLPGISSGSASKTVNTTNTYTNSNNTNSNVNSPNSSVGGTQPVAYNYNTTPVYNYNTYPSYPTNYPSLQVSCYPMPLNARTGDTITWYASAYGGNGSYNYTWSGNDSLSGYGQSISKTYYSSGYKNASVTVVSGGQTVSKNCDGSVNVRGDYNTYYPPTYYPPTYYPPTYNYYSPLSVSCLVSGNTYANTNNALTWNAYPSGGNGSYSYSWSGTDGIYGSSQSVYYTYPNPGVKYASVTVYSNGQSVTQNCGSANVGGYYYGGTTYIQNQNNNSGLDIACYSDPRTVTVNQPATWITEVTGGIAPYTYTWSGTNDLSGNTSSVIKYYGTTGSKSAIVTVRSADGRSETRACSTSVTVRSASAPAPTVQAPAPVQPDNSLSAAALFSLKNVPWGWVAIIIILVLFGTVIYLIYNRPKI